MVWRFRGFVRHHTNMDCSSTQEINDRCARVLSLPGDSPEFEPAVVELRAAIQQQITEMRYQVAIHALDIGVAERI